MSARQEPAGSQPGSRTAAGNVPAGGAGEVSPSPSAEQSAKDNIDLGTVRGTGADGRVTEADEQE